MGEGGTGGRSGRAPLPQPDLNTLLHEKLGDEVSDVAIAAAVHLGQQGTRVPAGQKMHTVVGPVLGEFGLLPRGLDPRVCHHQEL